MLRALLVFLFPLALQAQLQIPGDIPPNAEPGKCYAKCLQPVKYYLVTERFAVYTGDTSGKLPKGVKPRTVLTSLDGDKSSHTFYEVLKTRKTTDFEYRNMDVVMDAGPVTGNWIEVVCGNKMTTAFVKDMQRALKESGFYAEAITGTYDVPTKTALADFQRENDLPVGSCNVPTTTTLGLNY